MGEPVKYDIGPGDPYLMIEIKHQLIAYEIWSQMNARGDAIGIDHPFLLEEAGRIVRGHFRTRAERDLLVQAGIGARRIYHRLLDLRAIDMNFTPRRKR